MPVNIRGKEYSTVSERVADFRSNEKYQDYSIETEIISCTDTVLINATIKNEDGRIIANGHAEEVRGSSNINKTSALENCETSAIGRALAALNFGGEQFASANEVSEAIIQQNVQDAIARYIAHNAAVNNNIDTIYAVKKALSDGQLEYAVECMDELSNDDKQALSLASTKGGIWSLDDTKSFRSEEYQQARNKFYNQGEQL